MIMLAKIASWLIGPALLPMLAAGGLWAGGMLLKERRSVLISQGVKQCQSDWEIKIARQHQASAEADARAMQAQLNAADVLNMELKTNARQIEADFARVREDASAARAALAAVDGSCISDRVRQLAVGGVPDRSVSQAGASAQGGKRSPAP